MNISRSFLIMGGLYLLVGIGFGMYMGPSQDFRFAPLHAHINLLGFTLMTLFGIAYRVIPNLAGNTLARAHFWLHQIGALLLLISLFLMLSGTIPEATIGPIMLIFEIAVFVGILCWLTNILRNAP